MILTPKQRALVDGARERANTATKEPWRSCWDDATVAPLHEHAAVVSDAKGLPCEGMVVGLLWYDGLNVACRKEDARFIAHARQGIPALCDLVDELEERLRKTATEREAEVSQYEADIERALGPDALGSRRYESGFAPDYIIKLHKHYADRLRVSEESRIKAERERDTYKRIASIKKSSAKDP